MFEKSKSASLNTHTKLIDPIVYNEMNWLV